MVLIHFDALSLNGRSGTARCPTDWKVGPTGGWPADCVELVRWYSHRFRDDKESVFVLAPESCRTSDGAAMPDFGNAALLSYSDDRAIVLPKMPNRADIWIINGMERPIIEWNAARSVSRQRECDVLVLNSSHPADAHHYAEYVQVDRTGQVLGFRRYYDDSPTSPVPWSGSVSSMLCSGKHARTVVAHLVTRGWGLDAVGVLTRRFYVRWSDLPPSDSPAEPSMGSPRARYRPSRLSPHRPSWLRGPRKYNGHTTTGAAFKPPLADHPTRPLGGNGRGTRNLSPTDLAGDTFSGVSSGPDNAGETLHGPNRGRQPADRPRRPTPAGERPFRQLGGDALTYRFVKRLMDIVVSVIGLIVLSPLLLLTAALVKLSGRGPVIFKHVRQGRGGEEFSCLKFRTMIDGADEMQAQLRAENEVDGPQFKIGKDPRLTRLGDWLRRRNIDELPQLVNVLRGEMSLVGPRPSPDGENQHCPGWRRARLSVRPGITGLWQVLRLRDDVHSDFQEWIYYDLEYVRHRSLWLDVQLILHTPLAVFASYRLGSFARKLRQRGICTHSARIVADPVSGPPLDARTSADAPATVQCSDQAVLPPEIRCR